MVAAVVTVAVLGAAGIRARGSTPEGPKAMALTTTTRMSAPTVLTTTTVTRPRETSTTRPRPSTTRPVATVTRPRPKTPRPTTTSNPAQLVGEHHQDRETCLAVAAANHYRVVAANATWLQQQVHALTARHILGGQQYKALQIEEAQAQTEIEAQYAIDQSNCYLK